MKRDGERFCVTVEPFGEEIRIGYGASYRIAVAGGEGEVVLFCRLLLSYVIWNFEKELRRTSW